MDPLQVTISLVPTGGGFNLNIASNRQIEPNVMVQLLADAIKAVAHQSASAKPVIEVANRMPVANGVR